MFRKSQTETDHNQHELENLGQDQTQEKFVNLGPNRTRTHKTKKVLDQVGSVGPRKFRVGIGGPLIRGHDFDFVTVCQK